jgi:hypothetical protein
LPSELPATETVIEASDPADHLPATQRTAAREQNERQAHPCAPEPLLASNKMSETAPIAAKKTIPKSHCA